MKNYLIRTKLWFLAQRLAFHKRVRPHTAKIQAVSKRLAALVVFVAIIGTVHFLNDYLFLAIPLDSAHFWLNMSLLGIVLVVGAYGVLWFFDLVSWAGKRTVLTPEQESNLTEQQKVAQILLEAKELEKKIVQAKIPLVLSHTKNGGKQSTGSGKHKI